MKTKIKIPNGWRRLANGCLIKRGDMYFSGSSNEWLASHGNRFGWRVDGAEYIRRIAKPKARK